MLFLTIDSIKSPNSSKSINCRDWGSKNGFKWKEYNPFVFNLFAFISRKKKENQTITFEDFHYRLHSLLAIFSQQIEPVISLPLICLIERDYSDFSETDLDVNEYQKEINNMEEKAEAKREKYLLQIEKKIEEGEIFKEFSLVNSTKELTSKLSLFKRVFHLFLFVFKEVDKVYGVKIPIPSLFAKIVEGRINLTNNFSNILEEILFNGKMSSKEIEKKMDCYLVNEEGIKPSEFPWKGCEFLIENLLKIVRENKILVKIIKEKLTKIQFKNKIEKEGMSQLYLIIKLIMMIRLSVSFGYARYLRLPHREFLSEYECRCHCYSSKKKAKFAVGRKILFKGAINFGNCIPCSRIKITFNSENSNWLSYLKLFLARVHPIKK